MAERNRGEVLVVAGPGEAQDAILAAVAAQELSAEVVLDPELVAGRWSAAAAVLVAEDQAEQLAGRALPRRDAVFVVGADPDRLSAWSAPLSAQVIPLPSGLPWLGTVLAETGSTATAPVVAVLGGSGGVGASTLAAAIAHLAASSGRDAALVDVDPVGGGIDLLLGAERAAGWRWPRLNAAEGRLADLRPYLPVVDGVSVVATERAGPLELGREPLAAIIGCLRAWHSLVVVDPGRSLSPASREAVRLSSRKLLVVSGGVRGVAAARATMAAFGLPQADLVVRSHPGGLPADLVAEAVGQPLIARLPTESGLLAAAEAGEPPARGGRRRYRRAVAALVSVLTRDEAGRG